MHTSAGPLALIAALTFFAAACGQVTPAGEPAALPPASGDTVTPAAGACLEGEPDCNDTPATGADELPPPPEPRSADDDAPFEGALTVSDAVAAGDLAGIPVSGYLVIDGAGAKLCEVLAESLPPQCGGASIPVEGFEDAIGVPLQNASGVTWSDQLVALEGEIVDGTLVVDASP